jgi:hypothetical protein
VNVFFDNYVIQNLFSTRKTARRKVISAHLIISLSVALTVAAMVFIFWFPAHFRALTGGLHLFITIVAVDVVCGPLLTIFLYKTSKTPLALVIDLALIGLIQLAALGYGLYTLTNARPLAIVFEVDRFRVVSYADIPSSDLPYLPSWAKPWGLQNVIVVGLRSPNSTEERLANFDAALQGVEVGQRPQHWQEYDLNRPAVLQRAQPLHKLRLARADQQATIDRAVVEALQNRQAQETSDGEALLWLPIISRSTLDWIVLLDPSTLRIRAYAPVDGFI